MDFGIFIPPVADSWKTVKRAEELGFARAWFYDTQMLNSELFAIMAASAMQTSKIRLATGVLIPSNRIAPVAASGLATLNALAPGRIDFGISTGFTARRTMGLAGVKQADMEDYIRVVQGLLRGETVEWQAEGRPRKVRFLDPDSGAHNIKDPIPLHISAFGPKGRRLVARLGAGWITSVNNPQTAHNVMSDMAGAWSEAGQPAGSLHATAIVAGCALKDGEAYDSPRVKAQVGANSTIVLHSAAEAHDFGSHQRWPLPDYVQALVERYRPVYETYQPADARYLTNHRGHLMYLRPEEQDLCTAELIRSSTWTAPTEELRERIREMPKLGFSHFAINTGYGHPERLDEWAEVIAGV